MSLRPFEPSFFFGSGWQWRWLSRAEVDSRVAALGPSLAALPAGSSLGFAAPLTPETLVLDRAVRDAGLTAVPVAGPASGAPDPPAAARGCSAWVAGPTPPPATLEVIRVEPVEEAPGSPPPPAPGGAVVVEQGKPRRLSAADLAAAAAELAAALPAAARRPIAVLHLPLDHALGRLLLAWAEASDAALVLEPSPAAFAATAAWARPTLLAGGAAERAALRRFLGSRGRSRFDRLGAWVLPAGTEVAAPERRYWEERGVRLVEAPASAGSVV